MTMPMPRPWPLLCAGAIFLLGTVPAAAQPTDASLAARMDAFLREVENTPNDELVWYFPRDAEWTWVQTLRDDAGRARTGIWRFTGGGEAYRAITADGPVCDSFDQPRGEFGPYEGKFGMQVLRAADGPPWRRVRDTRFVPPGESAASTVFVEWRWEDGAWVIASFGDEGIYLDTAPRREAFVLGDTGGVPEDAAFAPADWYMVTVDGRRYVRYGLPRAIAGAARERLVRVGVRERVSIYAERGFGDIPEVIYLPVAPGRFQMYETPLPTPCS
jgi:hypothetical protein